MDLEAGIYNISLCGDNSYYGTVFLNNDEKKLKLDQMILALLMILK